MVLKREGWTEELDRRPETLVRPLERKSALKRRPGESWACPAEFWTGRLFFGSRAGLDKR